MKKERLHKIIFLSSFIISLLANTLPLFIFRARIRISICTLAGGVILLFMSLFGLYACISKEDGYFFLSKYGNVGHRFWRYNRPTSSYMEAFWIKAAIYFFAVPFHLPIMFFSTKEIHSLWSFLLLLIPQFVLIGMNVRKDLHKAKEKKALKKEQDKERIEQERREELGKWK
jgi:hypothetical protein